MYIHTPAYPLLRCVIFILNEPRCYSAVSGCLFSCVLHFERPCLLFTLYKPSLFNIVVFCAMLLWYYVRAAATAGLHWNSFRRSIPADSVAICCLRASVSDERTWKLSRNQKPIDSSCRVQTSFPRRFMTLTGSGDHVRKALLRHGTHIIIMIYYVNNLFSACAFKILLLSKSGIQTILQPRRVSARLV